MHTSRATAAILALALAGCLPSEPNESEDGPGPGTPALATRTLANYFPPPEAGGGWRTRDDAATAAGLGVDLTRLDALGGYVMSLPYAEYYTGVSGYDSRNKAVLLVKNGWLVGEYYNRAAAKGAMYYLASNGKSFTMMLVGRLRLDYPELGLGLGSRLYNSRWLADGLPPSDPRKRDITIDQVFRHTSGIIPQVEAPIANAAVETEPGWSFLPFTLGKDPDWPESAPLYYQPGKPETYLKGDTYSSVAFNHFSPIFRQVTGLEPGTYLREAMLTPIGVGRVDYRLAAGMGDYRWATAGNALTGARDFARIGYLLLHEGNWAGRRIFPAAWIRRFTTVAGYPNLRTNVDCYWGRDYPTDLYSTVGSGFNRAIVVPSLDLLLTVNGRAPTELAPQMTVGVLDRLFASVLEPYTTCDGRVMNPDAAPRVVGLTLINADNEAVLRRLHPGDTLRLASLPTTRLNIRAEVWPGAPGSVVFGLDGADRYRVESGAPFALAGDQAGDYKAWTPAPGAHTVRATPFSGTGGSGTPGTGSTVSFIVQ
jgi:CubicO group peptidase (beta-lactamase class C family)